MKGVKMYDLLLLMYLVFLFFEIILLLLYSISYFLTLIFLPFFFLKREKKRKKREFLKEFLEREFKREYEIDLKNNFKSRTIYFCYWIFIMLKAVSVCGLMYTLIDLTDLFFKNTGFSALTNSQINDFAVLFMLLLVSGFWRSSILEIRFYSFYRKWVKILKKWKKIEENEEKKETKVGI
jgi:hypothetical protein